MLMHLFAAVIVVAQSHCSDSAAYHLLDFWVGHWVVVDSAGHKLGTDEVAKTLQSCALTEQWYGAEGDRGMSLFYYNRDDGRWKQVWVEDDAMMPGGVREKHVIAVYADGGVRFAGEWKGLNGRVILNRTTLTPLARDRVHQVIESSRDGGTTWIRGFDAYYLRRPSRGSRS